MSWTAAGGSDGTQATWSRWDTELNVVMEDAAEGSITPPHLRPGPAARLLLIVLVFFFDCRFLIKKDGA